MSIFRFKKFEVINERSAMKVNTDGVLLGILMTISPKDRRFLDIGTGTGTIALLAAQRIMDCFENFGERPTQDDGTAGSGKESLRPVVNVSAESLICIHAIDIDEPSATEAAQNFRNSPWNEILHAHNISLDEFASSSADRFDLIFSNPPYFDNALQAPEGRRNAARHTSTGLSYREILDFAARRIAPDGRVAMVLPSDTENDLIRHARMNGLFPYRITRIRTVPRKTPNRIVAEFSRRRIDCPQDTILTIQNEGQYTEEYLSLTKDFYLFA